MALLIDKLRSSFEEKYQETYGKKKNYIGYTEEEGNKANFKDFYKQNNSTSNPKYTKKDVSGAYEYLNQEGQKLGYFQDSMKLGTHADRMKAGIIGLQNNTSWKVTVNNQETELIQAIANSFDCEADLYIQEKVKEVIEKYGSCSKSYLSDKAINYLKNKGIEVKAIGTQDCMTNRVYSFSLVDDKGKVLTDENGHEASIIMADCLIPDGYMQGGEFNMASVLDEMGYDCVSQADFIDAGIEHSEYQKFIQQMEATFTKENINNGKIDGYEAGIALESLYVTKDVVQSVKDLWGGHGGAPGYKASLDQALQGGLITQKQHDDMTTFGDIKRTDKDIEKDRARIKKEFNDQNMDDDKADNIAKAQSEYVFLLGMNTTGDESEFENKVIANRIRGEIAKKYKIDKDYLEYVEP